MFKATQELTEIKSQILNIKEWLILQSEVHNKMLQALKVTTNLEFKGIVTTKISDINTRIYEGEDLITNFTNFLKMHKYTIKSLQLILSKSNSAGVPDKMREDIVENYHDILVYNATKLKDMYPHECYREFEELVNLFYKPLINQKSKFYVQKRKQNELSTTFFPTEEIMKFVEN